MDWTCTLDVALKQEDRRHPGKPDEEMGAALVDAVKDIRVRIDTAFAHDRKFAARFKAH